MWCHAAHVVSDFPSMCSFCSNMCFSPAPPDAGLSKSTLPGPKQPSTCGTLRCSTCCAGDALRDCIQFARASATHRSISRILGRRRCSRDFRGNNSTIVFNIVYGPMRAKQRQGEGQRQQAGRRERCGQVWPIAGLRLVGRWIVRVLLRALLRGYMGRSRAGGRPMESDWGSLDRGSFEHVPGSRD